MVLAKHERKRKRTAQLHRHYKVAKTKLTSLRLNPLSKLRMATPRQPLTHKVAVDEHVVRAMEIETNALLYNQNPSTARALAVALSQAERSVMALYDDDENGDTMTSMMERWKRFSLLPNKEKKK